MCRLRRGTRSVKMCFASLPIGIKSISSKQESTNKKSIDTPAQFTNAIQCTRDACVVGEHQPARGAAVSTPIACAHGQPARLQSSSSAQQSHPPQRSTLTHAHILITHSHSPYPFLFRLSRSSITVQCAMSLRRSSVNIQRYGTRDTEIQRSSFLFRLSHKAALSNRKSTTIFKVRFNSHVKRYEVFLFSLGDYFEFELKKYTNYQRIMTQLLHEAMEEIGGEDPEEDEVR